SIAQARTRRRGSDAAAQYHLEHETAAHVREQQHEKAGERPAQRDAAAPAVETASREEGGEDDPRSDGEERFVLETQRPAEQVLGKEEARRQREREQHEPREDDAEQQAFHREQRRQRRERRRERAS